ncbi:ion transporter [Fulvivirga ligni]|uniref:ion transporter n=1 Tax=Fulvivirga ligni TaxID=2904246 RepID=UPI001F2373A9|nr:ion transporter [Fulvivirga ligni]UII21559.1 ion transporter [Fulvivirga ligni]
MKNKIFKHLTKGDHGSSTFVVFDYAIMVLITLNVIAITLETIPSIYQSHKTILQNFEIISIMIFTIEYLLRLYISDLSHPSKSKFKSALKFIFSFYGIIDLLAILPFYIPFAIVIDLRFLRLLRLMRFMRILKMNRYNNSLSLIWSVVKDKRRELIMTGFITLMIILISSFLMFYIEGPVQPNKFPNVFAAFWWAIATLTTVGYGDIYPITAVGKFVSGIIAILGIGVVALPTGIISAGFMEKLKEKKTTVKCPHCKNSFEISSESDLQ